MLAELQGQIERITYINEENGFTIARVKVYGQRDLVTIVGNLMAPSPGEILKMKGEWTNHPKCPLQVCGTSLCLRDTEILGLWLDKGYWSCDGEADCQEVWKRDP